MVAVIACGRQAGRSKSLDHEVHSRQCGVFLGCVLPCLMPGCSGLSCLSLAEDLKLSQEGGVSTTTKIDGAHPAPLSFGAIIIAVRALPGHWFPLLSGVDASP